MGHNVRGNAARGRKSTGLGNGGGSAAGMSVKHEKWYLARDGRRVGAVPVAVRVLGLDPDARRVAGGEAEHRPIEAADDLHAPGRSYDCHAPSYDCHALSCNGQKWPGKER